MNFDEYLEAESDINEDEPELEESDLESDFFANLPETSSGSSKIREGSSRISPPYLGPLTRAQLIAVRAGQLEKGYLPLVPIEGLKFPTASNIAKLELEKALKGEIKFPIRVVRRFPDGTLEIWEVSEFIYYVRD